MKLIKKLIDWFEDLLWTQAIKDVFENSEYNFSLELNAEGEESMKIKPCRVCGHQPSIVYGLFDDKWGHTIRCSLCNNETTVKSTEEQAITEWNNMLWSNGKPKTSGVYNVLYRTDEGEFVTSCYFDGADTWYHDVGINHDRVCTDKVIMWQPLPEIPEMSEVTQHSQHTELLEELRYYRNLLNEGKEVNENH